jgi:uncharacterized protein YabN with tetrapyrrole methylase and pyrophosphatase domain
VGGELTIVGTGVRGIRDFTIGTCIEIRNSDVVFCHVFEPTVVALLISLNPNIYDLSCYYGEAKPRRLTYIQMAERLVREARLGKKVAGVFSGHPGVFVMATRRARTIALQNKICVNVLPGISSVDALFADLGVDPGTYGFQVAKAGAFLRGNLVLAQHGHVAFLQVDSVGDGTYSFTGFKFTKKRAFIKKLIDVYGPTQEVTYYIASRSLSPDPVILSRPLYYYDDDSTVGEIGFGLLYIPPKGRTLREVTTWTIPDQQATEGQALAEFDCINCVLVNTPGHNLDASTAYLRSVISALRPICNELAYR